MVYFYHMNCCKTPDLWCLYNMQISADKQVSWISCFFNHVTLSLVLCSEWLSESELIGLIILLNCPCNNSKLSEHAVLHKHVLSVFKGAIKVNHFLFGGVSVYPLYDAATMKMCDYELENVTKSLCVCQHLRLGAGSKASSPTAPPELTED